jgi:hypothetical protein
VDVEIIPFVVPDRGRFIFRLEGRLDFDRRKFFVYVRSAGDFAPLGDRRPSLLEIAGEGKGAG